MCSIQLCLVHSARHDQHVRQLFWPNLPQSQSPCLESLIVHLHSPTVLYSSYGLQLMTWLVILR